jgi:NAD(P)-dependent dehydrogenase (short-subunit alcohol dehydrogenase family)
MQRFQNKVVVVTGAAQGIGKAVALRFGAEGAKVAAADLGPGVDGTVAEINAAGGTATAYRVDVTDFAAVEAMVNAAHGAFGGLDVVCNVAGIGHFAKSEEETSEWFQRIIAVNLTGSFHVARAALPHFLAAGHGTIINTASNSGLMGQAWSAAYCASKGGVVMLTKALASEYLDKNIRVNAVAPGGTKTAIQDSFGLPDGVDGRKLAKIMSPVEMAEPAEMANLFAWIASDEARFMTGSIVVMDGGLTA